MNRLSLSILALLSATLSFAQTADERVGAMMNGGQWFELKEFMETTTDSVNPFLDLYGKAMVAHFFNRPEEAIEHSSSLLNHPQIDLWNVASVGLLMCSDISKMGDNASAAGTLEAINASIQPYYEYLDSSVIAAIRTDMAKYKALSPYKVNVLKPFGVKAEVPFDIVAVGADSLGQEAINITGRINGHDCGMIFDTGAGVNVIPLSISGVSATIPEMPILITPTADSEGYDGRLGLASFMLFDSVSFDMDRMIIYPIKR